MNHHRHIELLRAIAIEWEAMQPDLNDTSPRRRDMRVITTPGLRALLDATLRYAPKKEPAR